MFLYQIVNDILFILCIIPCIIKNIWYIIYTPGVKTTPAEAKSLRFGFFC